MSKKRNFSQDGGYKDWFESQSFPLTESSLKRIETQIRQEVRLLKPLSVNQRLLYLKREEVATWIDGRVKNKTIGHMHFVKRMIWRPKGKSDFRRIEPQLIKVNNEFEVDSYNIWGESQKIRLPTTEPLDIHWDTLRTLVSSAPNDGTVGRRMSFLVIDRPTKQYLGVICISSAMYRIPAIHEEIGWDKEKIKKQRGSKLNCLANGQTIVPTQPFGSAFLGGKLLSLLCLSKEVSDAWETEHGDKLVGVHTTSLFGTETGTQYDNLNPYWKKLDKQTSSEGPIKLTKNTYDSMREWLRHRYPEKFYQFFVEKNPETGMLNTRESKTVTLKFCYQKLGLRADEYNSFEPRGVYSSFLFKNSTEYLRDEISVEELVPAFDNSIAALTEFWRYGSMGDTTQPTDEMIKKEKKPERIRKKIRMKGQTKGRIDSVTASIPTEIDWYSNLPQMSWDEIQTKYPEKSVPSEIPSSVL